MEYWIPPLQLSCVSTPLDHVQVAGYLHPKNAVNERFVICVGNNYGIPPLQVACASTPLDHVQVGCYLHPKNVGN